MSDSDNYLKILEKIGEVKEAVGVLNNEISHLKEDVREAKTEIAKIEEQDNHQNTLLAEHILGVKTATERLNIEIETRKQERELLEKQIKELDMRLKKAEFVPKLASNIRTALIWIAGLATAIFTIGKLLHKL